MIGIIPHRYFHHKSCLIPATNFVDTNPDQHLTPNRALAADNYINIDHNREKICTHLRSISVLLKIPMP